jgi:hypothetical protein
MSEDEGRFAVPGPQSMESEETLSQDERGEEGKPAPPPAPPKAPYPRRSLLGRLLDRFR